MKIEIYACNHCGKASIVRVCWKKQQMLRLKSFAQRTVSGSAVFGGNDIRIPERSRVSGILKIPT